MLEIGQQAPDFELTNQDGETVKFADYRGKKVVMFSFPKADTPGCTRQACGFRDNFPRMETVNAVVFGISADTPEELKAWKDKENLPYDLLSDIDHDVLFVLGATPETAIKERKFSNPIRSFWVFDEDGKMIAGQVRITPEESVEQALAAVGG